MACRRKRAFQVTALLLLLLALAAHDELVRCLEDSVLKAAIAVNAGRPLPPTSDFGESHLLGHRVEGPLPWQGDPRVEALRQKYGASVLMAAFRTTLPDPILSEEYNIGLAADYLAGSVVGPGEVFSLNRRLGPRTTARGYREGPMYSGGNIVPATGGGVCKVATTLYNVVILSDLQVVERHPHGMQVPYVPPGQDATISYGSLDFRFRNLTLTPVIIWSDTVSTTLFMAIYGGVLPPEIAWLHQVLSRQPPREVLRHNGSLPRGAKRVVMKGYDGLAVRSWLAIEHRDGRFERRDLGVDWYRPLAQVSEVNP